MVGNPLDGTAAHDREEHQTQHAERADIGDICQEDGRRIEHMGQEEKNRRGAEEDDGHDPYAVGQHQRNGDHQGDEGDGGTVAKGARRERDIHAHHQQEKDHAKRSDAHRIGVRPESAVANNVHEETAYRDCGVDDAAGNEDTFLVAGKEQDETYQESQTAYARHDFAIAFLDLWINLIKNRLRLTGVADVTPEFLIPKQSWFHIIPRFFLHNIIESPIL